MNTLCRTLTSWLFLVHAATSLRADVVTNLNPVADTSLFESSPDNNLGSWTDIPVGTTAGTSGPPLRSRGLMRFDFSQIPANAIVTSAALTLQLVKKPSPGVGATIGLNRMLRGWAEGTGNFQNGSPAATGEVTWNDEALPSTPWTAPGAAVGTDFVATASASVAVDLLGTYTLTSTPALVADVQMWLKDSGTNFGWMLLCQEEATAATARRFGSRESTNQPVLTLQYSLPSQATPPTLSSPVLAGNQLQFSFNAQSNLSYTVEVRKLLVTGSWSVLTNIAPLPSDAVVTVSDPITNTTSCYRVRTP